MNFGIIICTHGKTGVEIANSVEMIVGTKENIESVAFLEHNSPEEIMEEYGNCIQRINKENIVFLVDIKGGTPFNCAARMKLEHPNYEVITGVNIPLVISMMLEENDLSFKESLEAYISTAKDSIELLDLR